MNNNVNDEFTKTRAVVWGEKKERSNSGDSLELRANRTGDQMVTDYMRGRTEQKEEFC